MNSQDVSDTDRQGGSKVMCDGLMDGLHYDLV